MARRLTRAVRAAGMLSLAACGGSRPAATAPAPTAPLPTAGLAGQQVVVFPLTLVVAQEALEWDTALGPRRAALDRADSLIAEALTTRSPAVSWVLPAELRQASRRAAGMLADPDHIGTSLLRDASLRQVPDPLRSQMRSLTAVAGDRFALVPAGLLFASAEGGGRAELALVIADVRTGQIGWRTIANAVGEGPWDALRRALKTLTPDLP